MIVDGVPIARGSKIIMRPGSRRTDAQDIFLVGRRATVEAVLYDVDDKVHVAVTPDDDPAADLQRSHGRYLYFATDEIEPADRAGAGPNTYRTGGSGMIMKLVKAAVLAVVLVVIVQSIPDIKRYLELREM